jgi:GT2 family glycosyltransferase
MIRRKAFDHLGGFDESFPVNYNDVDLCLRAVEEGYRNVYTPYATLLHRESASRTKSVRPEEQARLLEKHRELVGRDPYWPDPGSAHRLPTGSVL